MLGDGPITGARWRRSTNLTSERRPAAPPDASAAPPAPAADGARDRARRRLRARRGPARSLLQPRARGPAADRVPRCLGVAHGRRPRDPHRPRDPRRLRPGAGHAGELRGALPAARRAVPGRRLRAVAARGRPSAGPGLRQPADDGDHGRQRRGDDAARSEVAQRARARGRPVGTGRGHRRRGRRRAVAADGVPLHQARRRGDLAARVEHRRDRRSRRPAAAGPRLRHHRDHARAGRARPDGDRAAPGAEARGRRPARGAGSPTRSTRRCSSWATP